MISDKESLEKHMSATKEYLYKRITLPVLEARVVLIILLKPLECKI